MIFPNYPELRGMKSTPEVGAFLRSPGKRRRLVQIIPLRLAPLSDDFTCVQYSTSYVKGKE